MQEYSDSEFILRHIGVSEDETRQMLEVLNVDSLDELVAQTIPSDIRTTDELDLPAALSEHEYIKHIREVAGKNLLFKSYIGLGYYGCIVPPVILRNVLENPGWYTQYTPYQAEISQGRLEALLNFQTAVCDLTGMEIANSSLLDEGNAAAEAMTMAYRLREKALVKSGANRFFVSEKCFPQTIDVLRSRSEPLGIELEIGDLNKADISLGTFGALLQYPDGDGNVYDMGGFIEKLHDQGALAVVAADIMSLALLKPPGESGADIVVGSTQRLGVPAGYGGPHAAYFATRDEFKRSVPGRIIGASVDRKGKKAYRMSLQTREQHIRREKATSNICTAQALLAVMAGMYCVYHGPEGLKNTALCIHRRTSTLEQELKKLGFDQLNKSYFDTLRIDLSGREGVFIKALRKEALSESINFRYGKKEVYISLDETTTDDDVLNIVNVFASASGTDGVKDLYSSNSAVHLPEKLTRTSGFLVHPVFNVNRSETKMLRYIKSLENKDLSLAHSMIPLGSCTMKLNATTEMIPVSWPEFGEVHPFVPLDQALGYREVFDELEHFLCEISGFDAVSLQPNSGSQGEYAGLTVIRAYHHSLDQTGRDVVFVPFSAHGTNPASAVMAGMKVVVIKCDPHGNIDFDDLKSKCSRYKDDLSAIMITYPSTHGVFETRIKEICDLVHESGGQVYMDGANLNAQVGLTNPSIIGADVCHINLHKTFSIPHGGGGPGMGPICVARHLSPFLPGHPVVDNGTGESATFAVSSSPWGSASILLISYAYIRLLGAAGVTEATKYAILNANYLKSRLAKYYPVLYEGENGRVAHEFILDLRGFKKTCDVDVEDIAKRLIDYGFHAPTMSWPVPGTLMIEPTESESKEELDRFCDALIEIRKEIREVERGEFSKENNVLKNSPHTIGDAVLSEWSYEYSREKACYPLTYLLRNKFWSSVGRVDNAFGDRNLVCTCPPVDEYEQPD